MAKRKDSKYLPGKRTGCLDESENQKYKRSCYNRGTIRARATAPALLVDWHIAEREGSELIYRGKVGSGF